MCTASGAQWPLYAGPVLKTQFCCNCWSEQSSVHSSS